MSRTSTIERKTKETDIKLTLALDGKGNCTCDTGIGFFDHMIQGFAKHGFFDVDLSAKGDIYVDGHHTVEDCGIVIGTAIREALGDKKGIRRYGSMMLPMDDALVLCAVDLGGRPYFQFDCDFHTERTGYFENQLVKEFFYAISYTAMINLHIKKLNGANDHHVIEAMFKAFAKALDEATQTDSRISDVLSTKGAL